MLGVLLPVSMVLLLYTYLIISGFTVYDVVDKPWIKLSNDAKTSFVIANGIMYPMMAIAFATGIKLTKSWYFKTKESEQLLKRKMGTELDLLKIQLQPHILLHSLGIIHSGIINDSSQTSDMVLNLSDLLSYILYESKVDSVLLEQELIMIKKYIALETAGCNISKDSRIDISGTSSHLSIAPLLLLPLAEFIFEQYYTSIEAVNDYFFELSIHSDGKAIKAKIVVDNLTGNTLGERKISQIEGIRSRLEILYSGRYTLEQKVENGKILIHFNILLGGVMQNDELIHKESYTQS